MEELRDLKDLTIHNVQSVVLRCWCLVFGVWCMPLYGVWCLVFGVWVWRCKGVPRGSEHDDAPLESTGVPRS